MRVLLSVLLVVVLSGCSSPDLRAGVTQRVDVEHSRFQVQFTRQKAEATRLSTEFGPAARNVMWRGYRAIMLATGCEIIPGTFDGDPALMRADLFCPL